jgi:outer membrane protein OmpA-like peptidoglycan-associated protein/tetratricopeptide (TPR) repeat protein
MKSLITIIILCIVFNTNAFAIDKSNKELKGDTYYFIYAFDRAIESYNGSKNLTTEGQRRLANSYSNIEKYTESEMAYSKLVTMKDGNLSEDYFSYSMILKRNGKYDESNVWMDKYKAMKPNDLRTKDYIAHKNNLTDLKNDEGRYKVEHLTLNTDAEDFGTSYYKNSIVFASSRSNGKMISRKSNWNGKPYLDIYISEVEGGQLKKPHVLSKKVDGKMHDGPASFTSDGNYMAYTKNNDNLSRKDKVVKLELFFTHNISGKWSKPEPFYLNNKDYSVGHPCLTANGHTMYFVSDMPGGYGGTDIYKVVKDEKGIWDKAENLGPKINTEGDEMFPFFEENKEVLFFASNGRFGLGGLDIFICPVNGGKLGSVSNAGYPLNTQYDDYAAIVNTTTNKGYFSSNRVGGSGDDDIYSFDLLKDLNIGRKIKGVAKDKNENFLAKTFITLFSDNGAIIDTMTTLVDGSFAFLVDNNKKFKLTGEKEKYIEGNTLVNTFEKEFVVKADVILLSKEDFAKKIVVGADLGEILELKPVFNGDLHAETVYFDLDKYNIRADAVIELNKVVKLMNEYTNLVVELGSYSDCRASKEYNQILSDKRAKVSAWYIKSRITKPDRIYGKGYGETKPVNGCSCEGTILSGCSEEDHQKNRRTEFIIIKK